MAAFLLLKRGVFLLDSVSARRFVFHGLFTAATILLTFVFAIQTAFLRLSFSFLPIALCGLYFGGAAAGLMTAAAGFLGTAVFGLGPFFPGFLLTDFATGFLFGAVLHGHAVTVRRTALAFFLVAAVVNLGLQTMWLSLFYGRAWEAFFLPRLVKNLLWPPVQVLLFCAAARALDPAARLLAVRRGHS